MFTWTVRCLLTWNSNGSIQNGLHLTEQWVSTSIAELTREVVVVQSPEHGPRQPFVKDVISLRQSRVFAVRCPVGEIYIL